MTNGRDAFLSSGWTQAQRDEWDAWHDAVRRNIAGKTCGECEGFGDPCPRGCGWSWCMYRDGGWKDPEEDACELFRGRP